MVGASWGARMEREAAEGIPDPARPGETAQPSQQNLDSQAGSKLQLSSFKIRDLGPAT